MDFNKILELPEGEQLRIVYNDLLSCHVVGNDAFKFGSALMLFDIILKKKGVKSDANGVG